MTEEKATDPLALTARTGLPDTLRALFEAHPREQWGVARPLGDLTQFWLERHQMLRALLERLGGETTGMLEAAGGKAPDGHGPAMKRLARYAQIFAGELQMHHNVEDMHYFPALSNREKRLAAGFELLDADHHTLDAALHAFAEQSNALFRVFGDGAMGERELADYHALVEGFRPMLERHLIDEEDLIVPILIEHGESWLR